VHRENRASSTRSRSAGPSDWARPGTEAEAIFAPRIYLADPDPLARAQLVTFLRDKGFDMIAASDMAASPPRVDAVIVALDGMASRANLPRWLLHKPDAPILVMDRSHVFPGRAAPLGFTPDARLSLPVPPRKLVATIRRVLSLARLESVDPGEAPPRLYRFAGWTLDVEARMLSREGISTPLDPREFSVLRALLGFPRQVLTRQQLIAMVWGADKEVENRTLDRPITRLRRHLGDDVRFPTLIKTIVGTGYRLDADVEKSV
jgi:DNA-binding response OmpR family regulator